VHDFDLLFSVKHVFDLGGIFSEDDDIIFTPTLISIYGTNDYGSNLLGSKVPRFTSNKRAGRLGTTATGKSQLQYVSIYLDFEYSVGKFYVEPQLLLDYTMPKAESQWTTIFSLTAGVNF